MPKCFLKTVGDFRLRCQHTYRHITDIGINLFEYINDVIEKTIEWQPNTPLENLPPPRHAPCPWQDDQGLDDKAIPLALERTLWQDAFLGKTSNNFTHSVCTNEDGITPCFS